MLSLIFLASFFLSVADATMAGTKPFVGSYLMLQDPDGLSKLETLAANAATLPITRLFIGFFSPTMIYVPGSKTLTLAGLNISAAADGGYAAVAASIANLTASSIDVLLSIGGWDYNCFPYAYTRYSVAGYGTNTPNYWKVTEYCGGDINAASAANEWCCEFRERQRVFFCALLPTVCCMSNPSNPLLYPTHRHMRASLCK